MSVFGIVCEFDPIHNGHKRLIDQAKCLGADSVVCVMSGNGVQRGSLAMLDKYSRAKSAILCGADLVLELPFPWSSGSAEYFARCGVKILSQFCTDIIFGSECGDIELLNSAGELASDEKFRQRYTENVSKGAGAAEAYMSLLEENIGSKRLGSNDILGIEYIKAARFLGCSQHFHTLKREGASYGKPTLDGEKYPSATALREALRSGLERINIGEYVPAEAGKVILDDISNGRFTETEKLSEAVLMYFRLADAEALSAFADCEGGIANRICSAARESKDINEFYDRLKTKRYTDAKMRRAVLFSLTEVKRELLASGPQYTTVLGANENGRALLSQVRKKEKNIAIVTKPADAPRDGTQGKANERLDAIFTLALKTTEKQGKFCKNKAFIL